MNLCVRFVENDELEASDIVDEDDDKGNDGGSNEKSIVRTCECCVRFVESPYSDPHSNRKLLPTKHSTLPRHTKNTDTENEKQQIMKNNKRFRLKYDIQQSEW